MAIDPHLFQVASHPHIFMCGFLSGLFKSIAKIFGIGGGPSVNLPPVAPPVAAPAAPTPIQEPTTATSTESSTSTATLPFINRKKTQLASGSTFGLGDKSSLG